MMSVCHKKDAARTYKDMYKISETILNWFSEMGMVSVFGPP